MQLQKIENKIHEFRGIKVMLDFDLAELYEVETKRLKEAVRRNINRFPSDFMLELTQEEYDFLRSQIATSKAGRGGTRYMPFAFTEQGVAMLSSVLNSEKAIEVNITIIRTFVALRQFALNFKEIADKLKALETQYNKQFKDVYEALNYLVEEKKETQNHKNRKRIGFNN